MGIDLTLIIKSILRIPKYARIGLGISSGLLIVSGGGVLPGYGASHGPYRHPGTLCFLQATLKLLFLFRSFVY